MALNAQLESELAEAARRENERLRKMIFDGIGDPAWMKSRDGVYQVVNEAWCAFTGRREAEAVGRRESEVFGAPIFPKAHQQEAAVIREGKLQRVEECFAAGRGEIWLDTVISPMTDARGQTVGVIGIARDITERKQMEEKFMRSQRVESIGALAGGIAHDLNNILGPIMMSASMLREPHTEETRTELVTAIQDSAQRGADIVRQVLTYTRGTKNEHKPLDARRLLADMRRILREILPKSIALNTTLPDELWNVTGNQTRLQQVLVNLCVNARDAMPGGGRLTLKAENCQLGPRAASRIPGGRAGHFVKIEVTDSGTGIAAEIIDKIFEPFFTTKEPGKGTGLGLSTVKEIVQGHSGFITVDSALGTGSKFTLYLPATLQAVLPPPASETQRPGVLSRGQGQRILVVDDEMPICNMVETILTAKGYKAIKAVSAHEALSLYSRQGAAIQAILTDVAMPDMDGIALARRLREINPCAVIIASTGQPLESRQKELEMAGVRHFLAKPYNAHQLLGVIQSAIVAAPAPQG